MEKQLSDEKHAVVDSLFRYGRTATNTFQLRDISKRQEMLDTAKAELKASYYKTNTP